MQGEGIQATATTLRPNTQRPPPPHLLPLWPHDLGQPRLLLLLEPRRERRRAARLQRRRLRGQQPRRRGRKQRLIARRVWLEVASGTRVQRRQRPLVERRVRGGNQRVRRRPRRRLRPEPRRRDLAVTTAGAVTTRGAGRGRGGEAAVGERLARLASAQVRLAAQQRRGVPQRALGAQPPVRRCCRRRLGICSGRRERRRRDERRAHARLEFARPEAALTRDAPQQLAVARRRKRRRRLGVGDQRGRPPRERRRCAVAVSVGGGG